MNMEREKKGYCVEKNIWIGMRVTLGIAVFAPLLQTLMRIISYLSFRH
jgi:hypothetical protein